jgi:hypothetical protein
MCLKKRPPLTKKGAEFWQTLLRYIEWTEGFGLIFLFSPKRSSTDLFRERLADKFQLQHISPNSANSKDLVVHVLKQLGELAETTEVSHAPIWIELDRDTTNQALSILFANLNGRITGLNIN